MLIDLKLREDVLKYFPNFEYLNCTIPERLDFSRGDNLVGVQQEAFLIFNTLKQLERYPDYGGGLDLGCGQGIHFACIGINDYCGECHPIYRGKYLPHVTSLAENVDSIFNNDTFNFIVSSHILEHVDNPMMAFRKWCKLLRKDGVMIILMPDARYENPGVGSWDSSHKTFWTPSDFKDNCISLNSDIMKTEIFNDLNNKFSMNYVGRRI